MGEEVGECSARRADWIVWVTALAVGALHYWEVVSHHHLLDNLPVVEQKVAALKTENAFYYSYFEEAVDAPTLAEALSRSLRDRRSEAPEVINAIHRFNIYQEVLCGLAYRALRSVIGQRHLPAPWYFFRHCSYMLQATGHAALVHLAAGCAGGGVLGGLLPGATLGCLLFLLRYHISRIQDVGMLNLRENWAMPVIICQVLTLHNLVLHHPALDSRGRKAARRWRWAFCAVTVACLLLWQFSAFAFLLQVSAVLLCTLLAPGAGPRRVAADIVLLHLVSIGVAAVLLFGNELLVHHMLVTQCAAILLVLRLRRLPLRWRILFWVDGALAVALFAAMRLVQSRWATAEEHIGEIFHAKVRQMFPDLLAKAKEPTFNARLYLAVSVFDFIDWGTILAAKPTGLYHFAALGAFLWSAAFARRVWDPFGAAEPGGKREAPADGGEDDGTGAVKVAGRAAREGLQADEGVRRRRQAASAGNGAAEGASACDDAPIAEAEVDGQEEEADADEERCWTLIPAAPWLGGGHAPSPAGAFAQGVLLIQLVFFLALGCFISRLKVIGAPFLCMLAAVSASPGPVALALGGSDVAGPRRAPWRGGAILYLAAAAAQIGQLAWLAGQLPFLRGNGEAHHRDFVWADGDRGELYEWMSRRLPAGSVVLTSMPLSAELRLNTPLRLAVHPQFEAQSLRDRVQELYQFYQCTPPEDFAGTMRRYNSSYLVLEYKRCDFGPFKLDRWPQYNCEKGSRPWEDLFCPRVHASPAWELLFANAGFALLRLREGGERRPGEAAGGIDDIRAWRPMLDLCLKEEPEACVSRTAELAQMFHAKLGKRAVAKVLFEWVRQHAEGNGQAQYILGHHSDYDLGLQKEAAGYYRRAAALAPNNPLIVREYLMWLDVEAKDNRSLTRLMLPRRFTRGERQSLLDLGDVSLACEASIPAMELFRDLDWAEELWDFAVLAGLGSNCVKNNWPLHNGGRSMEDDLGKWGYFKSLFWQHSLRSELVSTQSNGVRYQQPRRPWELRVAASPAGAAPQDVV